MLLGGSTTECLFLDQSETWGAIMGEQLESIYGMKVNIFNGGKSGLNSQDHLLQIEELLSVNNWIDIIIIMVGINDLGYALTQWPLFSRLSPEILRVRSFYTEVPDESIPFYKRSLVYKKIGRLFYSVGKYHRAYHDPEGLFYINKRQERESGVIIDERPNMSKSLEDYRKNISNIINICKTKGVKLVFVDQATIYSNQISEYNESLCWGGQMGESDHKGIGKFLSIIRLGELMQEYNSLLESECLRNNIPMIEISSKLEKDTTTFYDDCHFNESGARKVSDLLVKSLIELRIFDKYTDARQLQNGDYTPIKPTF